MANSSNDEHEYDLETARYLVTFTSDNIPKYFRILRAGKRYIKCQRVKVYKSTWPMSVGVEHCDAYMISPSSLLAQPMRTRTAIKHDDGTVTLGGVVCLRLSYFTLSISSGFMQFADTTNGKHVTRYILERGMSMKSRSDVMRAAMAASAASASTAASAAGATQTDAAAAGVAASAVTEAADVAAYMLELEGIFARPELRYPHLDEITVTA